MTAPATVRHLPKVAVLAACVAVAYHVFASTRGHHGLIPVLSPLLHLYGLPGTFTGVLMLITAGMTASSGVKALDLSLASIHRVLGSSLALLLASSAMLFIDLVAYHTQWYGAWSAPYSLALAAAAVAGASLAVGCALLARRAAHAEIARRASWA